MTSHHDEPLDMTINPGHVSGSYSLSETNAVNQLEKQLRPAPVADILLAHSRDIRFHLSLSRLLSASITPYLLACIHNNDSLHRLYPSSRRHLQLQRILTFAILPEIHLISNFLHTIIALIRTKQSLGMEMLQMYHLRPHNPLLSLLLVPDSSTSTTLSSSQNHNNGATPTSHSTTLTTSVLISRIILSSPWSSISFRVFFFIYSTVLPYLFHRASKRRNGWEDIQHILRLTCNHGYSLIRSCLGLTTHSTHSQHGQERSWPSSHEGLRGEERRRVFYEMRRQMVHRVATDDRTPHSNSSILCSPSDIIDTSPESRSSYPFMSLIRLRFNVQVMYRLIPNYRMYVWNALGQVASAMEDLSGSMSLRYSNPLSFLFPMEIDHEWMQSHDLDEIPLLHFPPQGDDDDASTIMPQRNHPTWSLIWIYWIFEIHRAMFYINGKYPTLFHRWTRTQMFVDESVYNETSPHADSSSRIHHTLDANGCDAFHRPSYQRIGYLLFLECMITSIKAVIRKTVELTLDGHIPLLFKRNAGGIATSIEAMVPSFDSQLKGASTLITCRTKCAICLNDRTNPACPKRCGHVFCWSCIQRWLFTVRMECPFCRTPTRPQDIVPLYHYQP